MVKAVRAHGQIGSPKGPHPFKPLPVLSVFSGPCGFPGFLVFDGVLVLRFLPSRGRGADRVNKQLWL